MLKAFVVFIDKILILYVFHFHPAADFYDNINGLFTKHLCISYLVDDII